MGRQETKKLRKDGLLFPKDKHEHWFTCGRAQEREISYAVLINKKRLAKKLKNYWKRDGLVWKYRTGVEAGAHTLGTLIPRLHELWKLILWVRFGVEDLEEGAIPVEQEPWVPEGGQQTPTPSARGEGVKKARLYLWSGGSPGSSILHQHQENSPTAGGGWENPVYTDLSKIQGRVWLPGRGKRITERIPKLKPKIQDFPRPTVSQENEETTRTYLPISHHQGSKPQVTSNIYLLSDESQEHWKGSFGRHRQIRKDEK